MVSKTDDIPASVPSCNPVDLADEAGDGAQDSKESSKTSLKESCGCGETLQQTDWFISAVITAIIHYKYTDNTYRLYMQHQDSLI